MKKRYLLFFLISFLVPITVFAKNTPVTSLIPVLSDNRIITDIAKEDATNESHLKCAEDVYIPYQVVYVIRSAIQIIKVVVPILLIIMGMLDFARVVLGKPDDQMKKSQSNFISRLIAAALIYFVISIVEFILPLINPGDTVMNCVACVVKDTDTCTYVNIEYPEPVATPTSTSTPKPTSTMTPKPTTRPSASPEMDENTNIEE